MNVVKSLIVFCTILFSACGKTDEQVAIEKSLESSAQYTAQHIGTEVAHGVFDNQQGCLYIQIDNVWKGQDAEGVAKVSDKLVKWRLENQNKRIIAMSMVTGAVQDQIASGRKEPFAVTIGCYILYEYKN